MNKFIAALAVAGAVFGTTASAATLDGETLDYYQNFEGTEFFNDTFVVGAGVEVDQSYNVDIDDVFITITLDPGVFFTQSSPNGPVFTDALGTIDAFDDLFLVSSTFTNAPTWDVTEDVIAFDFGSAGGDETAGGSATFQLSFVAAVPLPASLPLLLAGLGGIAVLRRRKSAA